MKWHILYSCGNSPKNQLLIEQFDFPDNIEEIRIETAISQFITLDAS